MESNLIQIFFNYLDLTNFTLLYFILLTFCKKTDNLNWNLTCNHSSKVKRNRGHLDQYLNPWFPILSFDLLTDRICIIRCLALCRFLFTTSNKSSVQLTNQSQNNLVAGNVRQGRLTKSHAALMHSKVRVVLAAKEQSRVASVLSRISCSPVNNLGILPNTRYYQC